MQHPFNNIAVDLLTEEHSKIVNGGQILYPNDGKAREASASELKPAIQPIYYTQAIGEDGGDFPLPDLT